MKNAHALILLIKSLGKNEKKVFKTSFFRFGKSKDFQVLYSIIESAQEPDVGIIKKQFMQLRPEASFESSANYLYNILLDTLVDLRTKQDRYFNLFNAILRARVLFEKSLFEKSFETLHNVMVEAEKIENYHLLLLTSRLESEYQLALNYPALDEKSLLNKHLKVNETLKIIRKINEHLALYEMLKFRILQRGNIRSKQQITELNDLVVSEMSIVASSNFESFEVEKLHQLFQSYYLLSVGDFKSSQRSFYELIGLFEANKHLWSNPPIYFLLTIEGVLDSLRSVRKYNEMGLFVEKLKSLRNYSVYFNANVDSLIYLYELYPLVDTGNFTKAFELMHKNEADLMAKYHLLNMSRQTELSMYGAIIMIGRSDFRAAHKFMYKLIRTDQEFYDTNVYRTIRLIYLVVLYEMNDFDRITSEIRSIKRLIKYYNTPSGIEKYLFKFVHKPLPIYSLQQREKLWKKKQPELEAIRSNVFERQILKHFDFTVWIESKIRKMPLSEILQKAHKQETAE